MHEAERLAEIVIDEKVSGDALRVFAAYKEALALKDNTAIKALKPKVDYFVKYYAENQFIVVTKGKKKK